MNTKPSTPVSAGQTPMSVPLFELHRGNIPLLISIPHLGTGLPAEFASQFSEEAGIVQDTDWHLDRLYEFAHGMQASVLGATVSRYVIDLNRSPDGQSLYPGQTTTGLCPTETFLGTPLYPTGYTLDAAEIERRKLTYWQPYHEALKKEIERLRARHGHVLLWEAHSIASVLPRLFDGKLPDLNLGTNSGESCAAPIIDAVTAELDSERARGQFTHITNGRFKGGYITRHYGRPAHGVHAIQLEMCQSTYMNETAPLAYRPDLALRVQPLLQSMLSAAVAQLHRLPAAQAL